MHRREDVPVWAAARLVAVQVWPLLALAALAVVASVAVVVMSGTLHLAQATWWFMKVAVLGLVGSYAVHETAHLVLLRRIETVHLIALARTGWRASLTPVGAMTPRQVLVTAVAGPASSVLVGLAVLPLDTVVAVIYLAHGLQLLPTSGDGRAVIRAARGHGLPTPAARAGTE